MKTLLILAFSAFVTLSGSAAPEAAFLRGNVTVEDDVIRLADLFTDADKRGDLVVASAPSPGRRDVITAQQLRTIARRAGLRWRPRSRYDRVVVRRAARIIGADEMKRQLRAALLAQGMPKSHRIALAKSDMELHAAIGVSRPVRLANTRYSARSGRFGAVFLVPTGAATDNRVQVNGAVYEVVAVPVLARHVRRDEVIRARDLTTLQLRRNAVANDAFLDPTKIVGLTPRRFLRQGVPLRPADLRPPILVRRGSLVTVTLRTERILITARARAIENGARGDVVRVVNQRSKKTIEGVVSGPAAVIITTPSVSR